MVYPYSLSDYANEVGEFLYKKGVSKPHVIAHSFGARVTFKCLKNQADFFDRLVLTGAAGLKPKRTVIKGAKRLAFNLLKGFVDKKRLAIFYSKEYQSLPPVMQKSFILVVNEVFDDYISKVKNKTLLVFGDKDRQTPLYMAKKFNREIENSTLKIYKGAGHFPFIDYPHKFNGEVREFFLS